MSRADRPEPARATPGRGRACRHGAALIAVLTAVLTAAPLTACTATPHGSPVTGDEPGSIRPNPPGPSLVPGISGPPPVDPNPYAGTIGLKVRPHITLSSIPPAGSPAPTGLPLDAYLQAAVQQEQTLSATAALLAQRCMSAAGFGYPVVPKPDDQILTNQFVEHEGAGLTSLSQAKTLGFQLPPGGFQFPTKIDTPLPSFTTEQRKHGSAWASALLGAVPGARPGSAPLGCLRAANTLLFGNLNGDLEGGAASAMLFVGWTWAKSDPHVLAAERAWSACMAKHGLHYQTTVDLEWNRTWPNPPTPAEITAAVADVGCNQQANMANTYLAVEAAYQRAAASLNQPALQWMQAGFIALQQRGQQVLRLPAADILRLSRVRVSRVKPLLVPRL